MDDFLRKHSLGTTLAALFLASWVGQGVATAWHDSFAWSEFFKDTLENWQSEFLQLMTFVMLTKWLREKDSHESKEIEE